MYDESRKACRLIDEIYFNAENLLSGAKYLRQISKYNKHKMSLSEIHSDYVNSKINEAYKEMRNVIKIVRNNIKILEEQKGADIL